ncbi:MAG: DUF6644 family protein [Burkholderiales bacterium]
MSPGDGTGALAAIERSAFAAALRGDLWLYPVVEIVHIAGFVVLVGSVVMFDLRLLGLSRAISVRALARHLLPWSAGALIVIVPTGIMMFSAHATDFVQNPAFLAKLTLIVLALSNALAFHAGVFRTAGQWDLHAPAPASAKLHALASLVLWLAVISCGRLIAYI